MNRYASNPLKTRADVARLAADLIAPLAPCLSEGKARLNLGDTGAVYDPAIAGMEGFSRVLWALVPMLALARLASDRKSALPISSSTAPTRPTRNTGATSAISTSAWWKWP